MSATAAFIFYGCLELRELTAHEARDARELIEELHRVPLESIFYHASASLLHRPVVAEAYPNDFALWAGTEMGDRRLAERLAAVEAFPSGSMEDVREALIATIQDHLQHQATPFPQSQGEPFRFMQIHLIPVPTGHEATTLTQFRDALAEVDVSALFYHVIEARYRLGRDRDDFAEWFDRTLGLPKVADRLARIDPYVGSLERLRDRHLEELGRALEEGNR